MMTLQHSRFGYFWLLCLFLLIKVALMVFVIFYAQIGLAPDEAQYWTWSQQLDWGYYSKPPGIAWQIGFGSQLFGNTELGVRFGSLLLGVGLAFAVYGLTLSCGLTKRTAFWAGIVMAYSPLGVLGSLLATTDGGSVLAWTISCAVVATALYRREMPNFILVGICVFFGVLFKWTVFIFWPFVLLFCGLMFSQNQWKKEGRHFFYGVAISAIGLFPSVIWNRTHEWATFRHVFNTMLGGPRASEVSSKVSQGNVLEFVGAQAALISPVLFIFMLIAFCSLWKNRKRVSLSLLFCGFIGCVLIFLYAALACLMKIQGNWCVFAYPPSIVVFCYYLSEEKRWGKRWLWIGTIVSITLTTIALSLPYVQSHFLLNTENVVYKINPFKHNVGWYQLPVVLKEAGYHPEREFLFGDKYQTTSLLSFYSEGQKRAYFLNLLGTRKNQFSYWPQMADEKKGQTGFFVWVMHKPKQEEMNREVGEYKRKLTPFFNQVELVGIQPLLINNGKVVKAVGIIRGIHYNGLEPRVLDLY